MQVYILIVLCLKATAIMGQGDSFSGRTENEEGYGPQRVEAPPSAPVTIPATATVAANAFSAALIQSTPKSAIAVGTVRIPAPVQPPMMLMPYSFQYGVDDDESGLDFGHKESSDGAVVTGTYYVQLPDGRMETVNYKADANGYVAEVSYEGEAKYGNAQPQKGTGSSSGTSGTSAPLKAPPTGSVQASASVPPTIKPLQPLPITRSTVAATKVPAPTTKPEAPGPIWPAVKAPLVPLAPSVAPTPSVIPATAAPVVANAPAPSSVSAAPTAVWTQSAVSSPTQLPKVTTAQVSTTPAEFGRSTAQSGVQPISYGQPLPLITAPVPAYPVAPIPLIQSNTPKPAAVNPYSA